MNALLIFWENMHRHSRKNGKALFPLSHRTTQCNDYLPCHSGGHLLLPQSRLSHLYSRLLAASQFFSQMPTLLFVEMLPSWRRLKYICVCVDVCVWLSVCGGAQLCVCVCLAGGWVGVNVEWKAVSMERWMTQTGHSGRRLVSGPYSHNQAGCSIWQLTESLQAPSLHSPTKRSALQSAPLPGCLSFLSHCRKTSIRPLGTHLAMLDFILQVQICSFHTQEGNTRMCLYSQTMWHPQDIKFPRQMIMHAGSYV